MTTTETIFQCASCLRFFADGEPVSISIGEGLELMKRDAIQSSTCDRPDCPDVCKLNWDRAVEQRRARIERRHGARRAAVTVNPHDFRSSCPPEREFSTAEGAAFASAPESDKEAFLDYVALTESLHEFLGKKHFGEWFMNRDLVKMLEAACGRRMNNFNNVMSKLRARYEAEGLALDVDTDAVTATLWRVRVCGKEQSLRLQRENPKRKSDL